MVLPAKVGQDPGTGTAAGKTVKMAAHPFVRAWGREVQSGIRKKSPLLQASFQCDAKVSIVAPALAIRKVPGHGRPRYPRGVSIV
jgi:hypothetical protein